MVTQQSQIDYEWENYKLLKDVVLHESKAMWETSNLFLLSNTILATISGASLLSDKSEYNKLLVLLVPILGLLISILWGFSYRRTSKYYKFRMAQIRKLENDNYETFNIFSGDAKKISDGKTVIISDKDGDKEYNARVLGRNFRSLLIVNIIIWLFIAFFISISVYFSPWGVLIYKK